jgi:hypothetical protein
MVSNSARLLVILAGVKGEPKQRGKIEDDVRGSTVVVELYCK